MAEVLLYELPKVVTSVFVLVPKTAEEKEFVTVIDKDKKAGKKLPGGGASKDRAIPNSAQAEVFEETHLVINPPARKVLEVHKTDKDGHPHHWVAVKSLPAVSCDLLARKQAELSYAHGEAREALEHEIKNIQSEWPLEPGEEIAEVRWETTDGILQSSAEHKFFRDHRVAFKWYLSGRSQQALDDILLDTRVISYFVEDDGCLVLCYDPACAVCERDEEEVPAVKAFASKEETMEAYFPEAKSGRPSRLSYGEPFREVRPLAVSPNAQKISGRVELMFVSSDRFEERIWLLRDPQRGFRRDNVTFETRGTNTVTPHVIALNEPSTVAEVAERFGLKAERQVSVVKSGVTAVFIVCGRMPAPKGYISFSLNDAPPLDLKVSIDQVKTILGAVERFNHIHSPKTLWMHDGWRGLIGRIKSEESLKRQAARERGQSFAPIHA